MQRTSKSTTTKTLNKLGESFKAAKTAQRLKFKATLLDLQELDGVNYWRAFRDVWQYSDRLGIAPWAIISTAGTVLGFSLTPKTQTANDAI